VYGILVEETFMVGFGDLCRCSSVYCNSLIGFQIHHHQRHLSNWCTADHLLLMHSQGWAYASDVQILWFDLIVSVSELHNKKYM